MININKLKKEIALNNLSIEELSEKIGIEIGKKSILFFLI